MTPKLTAPTTMKLVVRTDWRFGLSSPTGFPNESVGGFVSLGVLPPSPGTAPPPVVPPLQYLLKTLNVESILLVTLFSVELPLL